MDIAPIYMYRPIRSFNATEDAFLMKISDHNLFLRETFFRYSLNLEKSKFGVFRFILYIYVVKGII